MYSQSSLRGPRGVLLAALALTACAASPCGLVAGFAPPPACTPQGLSPLGRGSPPPLRSTARRTGGGGAGGLQAAAAPGGGREEGGGLRRRDVLLAVPGLAAAVFPGRLGGRPAEAEGAAGGGKAGPAPGTRAYLRITLKLVADGELAEAESRLSSSITEWDENCPLELAVLYKYRGDVRTNLGQLESAVKDFSLSIENLKRSEEGDVPENVAVDGTLCVEETGDPEKQFCIYVPAQSDLYLRRARVSMLLRDFAGAEESFSSVISIAEEEGTRNPWALLYRGDARMAAGRWAGAEGDYAAAQKEFKNIGDGVTAEVARAGKALALYGQGRVDEAVPTMSDVVMRTPSVTGDLELLLSLSDKEAEMHAALAAHYWSVGRGADAEGEWDRACVRMDAMNEFAAKRIAASPFDRKGEDGKVIKAYLPTNLVGCKKYREKEYLVRSKMWPPTLVENMGSFFSKKRAQE